MDTDWLVEIYVRSSFRGAVALNEKLDEKDQNFKSNSSKQVIM